jgi:rabenosyn-5
MLQSIGDVREGFICPECHQDMSTIEMLHIHFEDVHTKQSSNTVKSLFSLAKQKIKSVQDNFTTIPTEQPNNYSQFFSFDQNSTSSKSQPQLGYICSYNDELKKFRKEKHDQTSMETIRLLLRLEQLTSNDENVPKNTNTKERRKFEQDIVEWMDESKVSLCPSCAKTFGLSRRKHHCRLDGFVVCKQCTQFLPFSIARYLIEPQVSSTNKAPTNGVTLQRSNSLTSLTSTVASDDLGVMNKDGTNNEGYLRICLSCRQVLQRRYDQLCFKNADKDEVFLCYEKIVEARNELASIHPTYSAIIESLLTGDTTHQIIDGQRLYRRLTSCYEKIDSTSYV